MLRQHYLNNALPTNALAPDTLPVLQPNKPGVLALIAFDNPCIEPAEPGVIPIGIPSLSGKAFEVIEYGDKVAERGITERCHWSNIDDVFCAATWISPAACADIESATEDAYSRLFRVITDAGFPYPFRIWNFIPNINSGAGDREEYKKFCVGRLNAFNQLEPLQQQFPAASALGIQQHTGADQGAVIYMLATSSPGRHHENPRQQPAYQYPRQYGPSSPSFARATSINLKSEQLIFVSGTASIIGHDTKACGNLEEQLEITLDNISHLLNHIDPQTSAPFTMRVYLRHQTDLAATQAYLSQRFPENVINIVHADICRDNLLVEIECASCTKTAT
ncbi:MAG: dioxygenase [Moraxellaceae bacterium]|nr:MAG: dioxygenase [Moraxellaceae bacterium]